MSQENDAMTPLTDPAPAQEEIASQAPEAVPSEAGPAPAEGGPPAARKRRNGWRIFLLILGALAFLFVFFLVSVTLLDFTESTAFCTSCHVMDPEETAYHSSPHARTDCGTCHIGPGALHAVQAKLASARYLWVYPLGQYEKPVPSPITSMRPAEVVCEQCHWPQKFYDKRIVTIPEYAPDEENSLTQTGLVLNTGGGPEAQGLGRGIHWHIENPVYYIATDEKRQNIPWVSAEYNGVVTEYVDAESPYTPEELAQLEKRKMDCIDCHNRASHIFRNPDDALDSAMFSGQLPSDLPELKKVGSAVLGRTYATEEEAAQAIAGVEEFYKTQYPDIYAAREADVKAAVAGLQTIFDNTQFPFMNVTWESHKNNIGHKDFPGCFRCHDGKHLSADNQAIRLECNLCHSIPQVAGPGQPLPPIPVEKGNEPESHLSTTWLAEHRYYFDATCAECHTVSNPGGSDNSSFCSNSACHGTEWKYAGLNAPEIQELSAPPEVPSSGVPNPIPHPIGATTDCKICHGPEGVRPAPENHASFTPDMCTGCHQAKLQETPPPTPEPSGGATPEVTPTPAGAGGPPLIPHPIEGRQNCNNCHAQGAVKPAPASHAAFTSDMCLNCHQPSQESAPKKTPTPAGSGAPPVIPHPVQAGADCKSCHGQDGIKPAPASHAAYTNDMCTNCHQPAIAAPTPEPGATAEDESGASQESAGPPAIPHDLEGRENCLMCHDPSGNLKPAPADHAGRTSETCQACHKPER